MSSQVVFIAGSPSPTSRSSYVTRRLAAILEASGLSAVAFSLRDFDPADVFHGKVDGPSVVAFLAAVKTASAIVLATPVYKATYAGVLKAIVDLVPPDALVQKPALGIATSRQPGHAEDVDRAYRALFGFFRARALPTLVVLDEEIDARDGGAGLAPAAEQRVEAAARELLASLQGPRA